MVKTLIRKLRQADSYYFYKFFFQRNCLKVIFSKEIVQKGKSIKSGE